MPLVFRTLSLLCMVFAFVAESGAQQPAADDPSHPGRQVYQQSLSLIHI